MTDSGSIVASGGTLNLSGTWSQFGTLAVTNSTVNLQDIDIGFQPAPGQSKATTILGQFANKNDTITVSGLLDNSGGALKVGPGSGFSPITLSGTIAGGVIADAGSGLVFAGGTLSGTYYEGTVDLSPANATLSLAKGVTLTGTGGSGAGAINLTGRNSALLVTDSETLDNATITAGNALGSDVINLYPGSDPSKAGLTLTLGSHLALVETATGAYLTLGEGKPSGATSVETLVNNGTITAGNGAALSVTTDRFTNNGTISLSGAGTVLRLQGTGLGNLSGTTLSGGTWQVASGAVVQLADNAAVQTLAAAVTETGTGQIQSLTSNAQVTLDATLTTIAAGGKLTLGAGHNLSTTQALTDGGALQLAGGTLQAPSLTVSSAGLLAGFGTVQTGVANAGTVTAAGGTLVVQGSVSGAGALTIAGTASLDLKGAVAAVATIGFLSDAGTLTLDAPTAAAPGAVQATIARMFVGDTIDLTAVPGGAADTVKVAGTVLTISNGSTVEATLALSNTLAGQTFIANADGHGGTAIGMAGTPNAPPATTVVGAQTVTINKAAPISGISIADADAASASETLSVVLTDATGALSASGAGTIGGSGTAKLTLTGTLAQVNADLATLTYQSSTPGTDSIDVATDDGRGGTDDHQIPITVNAPPVTTVPGAQTVQQGAVSALGRISIADSDADSATEIITVVLSDAQGKLAVAAMGTTNNVTGSGTTNLTITGGLSDINKDLAGLTFTSSAGGSDTIDVATNDGRGGADDHKITVTIDAPPVTTVPGVQTMQQGAVTALGGISIADSDAVSATEIITVVLSDAQGKLAVAAMGTTNNVTGSGTTNLTITGGLSDINKDLAGLAFTSSTAGVDMIDVATSDGRGGTDDHQIAVTVNAIPVTTNAPPSGSDPLTATGPVPIEPTPVPIEPTPVPIQPTEADMILRRGDGSYEIYTIANNAIQQGTSLGQVGTDYQFAGLGNFGGSGSTDMMLHSGSTGNFEVYDIKNNSLTGAASLGAVGPNWELAGFGSFTGTASTTGMMLRDANTGSFECYQINNNAITGAANIGAVGLDWQVAGFGDFNGDGTSDMMLRNASSGTFEAYDINNGELTSAHNLGAVGLDWQVAGFGNFQGPGTSTDMMLRNATTGMFELYDIGNNAITGATAIGAVGLDWHVAGFGDFNGDGTTDMMLRNTGTGAFEAYDIQNGQLASAHSMGAVGLDWQIGGFSTEARAAGQSQSLQLAQAMSSFAANNGAPMTAAPLASADSPRSFLATPHHAGS